MQQRVYKNIFRKVTKQLQPQNTTKTNSEEREFDFQSYYFIYIQNTQFSTIYHKACKEKKYDPCIRVNFSYKEADLGLTRQKKLNKLS